jgi:proteasome lid subunit RPN8/RPN11
LFLRDRGSTEVAAFGLAPADDLLYVEEIRLIRQQCTAVSVGFDDLAVADFFEQEVDRGRTPEQFARIWIHTHPGNCPLPSHVDEETFARVFGGCDWAVMCILAKEGQAYCRLQFRHGPGAAIEIPVHVDFDHSFLGTDRQAWAQEFAATVTPAVFAPFGHVSAELLLDDAELIATAARFDDPFNFAEPGKDKFLHEQSI